MSQLAIFDFLNWSVRLALAQLVTFVLLMLNVSSLSLPHAGDLKPFFLLMVVYYWSIYRPTVMPIAYTFILGILIDLLSDMPVGVSALILMIVQIIVLKSRLFLMGQPFIMVWLGFGIVSFAYALLSWFLLTLINFVIFPKETFVQVLIAGLLTALIFPLVTLVLQAVHRILPTTYDPLHSRG